MSCLYQFSLHAYANETNGLYHGVPVKGNEKNDLEQNLAHSGVTFAHMAGKFYIMTMPNSDERCI